MFRNAAASTLAPQSSIRPVATWATTRLPRTRSCVSVLPRESARVEPPNFVLVIQRAGGTLTSTAVTSASPMVKVRTPPSMLTSAARGM